MAASLVNLLLVFCLIFQTQYIFARDKYKHNDNDKAVVQHTLRNFKYSKGATDLDKYLEYNNAEIQANDTFKTKEERNIAIKKFLFSVLGGAPFAGATLQHTANILFVDEDKPQNKFDDYTEFNVGLLKSALLGHPEDMKTIFDKTSYLRSMSEKHHESLQTEGITVNNNFIQSVDKKFINLYNQLHLGTKQQKTEIINQIKNLTTEAFNYIDKLSRLDNLLNKSSEYIETSLLTDQDKLEFKTSMVDLAKAESSGDKQLRLRSIEKIMALKSKNDILVNVSILGIDSRLKQLHKNMTKEKVNVGEYDFTKFYDHEAEPELAANIDALAVGYAFAKSLNSFASLSNDPKFQKATGAILGMAGGLTGLAHSVNMFKGATSLAAQSAAVASGVGAAVAIISVISSLSRNNKNKQMQKMFKHLFKKINHIIKMLEASLENQQIMLANQEFMIMQNSKIIKMLNQVQVILYNLENKNQINHMNTIAAIKELSSLQYHFSVREQSFDISKNINSYLDTYVVPLTEITLMTNALNDKILYTIDKSEISLLNEQNFYNNKYLESLDVTKNSIYDRFYKHSELIGSALALSEYENYLNEFGQLEFKIIHKKSSNIFGSSMFAANDNISEFNVSTDYATPDFNTHISNDRIERLYSYDSQLVTHDLAKMYEWIVHTSDLSGDNIILQYDSKNSGKDKLSEIELPIHNVNNNASEILLFGIAQSYLEAMNKLYRYTNMIPQALLELIKKRLKEVRDVKNNYRAIIPVVLNKYRAVLANMTDKTQVTTHEYFTKQEIKSTFGLKRYLYKLTKKNKIEQNVATYPLVAKIKLLEDKINSMNKLLDNNSYETTYNYDERYSRLRNSHDKYANEPHLVGKSKKYNFVQMDHKYFNWQNKSDIEILDSADIRSDNFRPKKSFLKSIFLIPFYNYRKKIIHPMTNFIDTNELGRFIEETAVEFGLISVVDRYKDEYYFKKFIIENMEPYTVFETYHSHEKGSLKTNLSHSYHFINQIITRNKDYSSKYHIIKTPSLDNIDASLKGLNKNYLGFEDIAFQYRKFGQSQPILRELGRVNNQLLYTGYIRGQMLIPGINYNGIDAINHLMSKGSRVGSSLLVHKRKKGYDYDHTGPELLDRYTKLYMKKAVNNRENFDKLYADSIENGVFYLKASLEGLLRLLKHDLAYIYAQAATNLELDFQALKLANYYELNDINLESMYADIKKDLELTKHYRLALSKLIDYAYSGCEKHLAGVSHLYHFNKINMYSAPQLQLKLNDEQSSPTHDVINDYFAIGESFNNSKLSKYYNAIKDLNIGLAHITYPLMNTKQFLPEVASLVESYKDSQKLHCGLVNFRNLNMQDEEKNQLKTSATLLLESYKLFEEVAGSAIAK